ncbi:NRDE family protein [Chitinophaga arvensicola]|uniref:ATP-grasp domain-containing protein n=1 Tax=Chitinophaga arvensicola TaxID=29529 RepID=A0A1I0SDN9_9BACT|nr:NRDE family protein [Chitinophaga arvensicola]SEW57227.1 ATP-grasp domain-containing protein [Chitinophaga arvensicola]
MCTVTYIPTCKGIYLTTNRDESTERSKALPPRQYRRNGFEMIYPQDQDAGGSWVVLKENGDAAVLLNGAFTKHIRQSGYRKSRGVIFLEIMAHPHPYREFAAINLSDIEPFTLVVVSDKQLWECRWDGSMKHLIPLNADKPYIWSSATLFDNAAAQKRKLWFLNWFSSTSPVNLMKIMEFHRHAGGGDLYNGLVINRGDKMRTVSITSLFVSREGSQMNYHDLLGGIDTVKTFNQSSLTGKDSFFERAYWYLKKVKISICHWEYWPSLLVYGPLYPYWCWLSLKACSLFFFSAANPGIEYSGFVQERKSDIYRLIPQQYYPRTTLCRPGQTIAALMEQLKNAGLTFPVIAKPDMGEKGKQVKLLTSDEELEIYNSRSKVDFLLQEFIAYEQEVGIFYYRIPGEARGHISGIVGKEFLAVKGDGRSSIRSLLKAEDRFLLQLSDLAYTYGDFLDTVLARGQEYILVPYGNHSRGAKFIDLKDRITEPLTLAIDKICQQIPGFYYGRLDIKFNSWTEMQEGKKLCIIELNGAGSEPTHIYDPANSLRYAWKEICRHWRLLYRISRLNAGEHHPSLMTTADGIKMMRGHFNHLKQISKV